ncbi:hypothetical protein F4810DRAFT_705495 [Camillea tinctor]|nr:hypothetical protein F4810DRAFT_705495 [Camillea tinctor]
MSMLERLARYNHSKRRSEMLLKPKPIIIITDDGQNHSVFSKRRDIMNQASQDQEDDSSAVLTAISDVSSIARSLESLTSDEAHEIIWSQAELLELSDSVRENLRNGRTVGRDAEQLSSFLETALKDEGRKHPSLDYETIVYARLDKLIADILHFAEMAKVSSFMADLPLRFRVDVSHAKGLRKAWRRRLREKWIMIDQHRCAVLVEGGRLKDVSFNNSLTYDLGKWQTKTNIPISELEVNLKCEPGHWWLNITCAERDGIVASSLEMPTKGRYGITALPLLSGKEELIRYNTVKYIREGRSSDMHIALISQVGRQIRILRGYRLKSILAPQAGVRYDGLFTIKQYGCKLDDNANTYRLELTLERVAGQKSFEEVKMIPKPSQLDDWNLYEKLEGDKIKLLRGETSYLEWKLQRQEEKIDREDWRRASLFRASFSWRRGRVP